MRKVGGSIIKQPTMQGKSGGATVKHVAAPKPEDSTPKLKDAVELSKDVEKNAEHIGATADKGKEVTESKPKKEKKQEVKKSPINPEDNFHQGEIGADLLDKDFKKIDTHADANKQQLALMSLLEKASPEDRETIKNIMANVVASHPDNSPVTAEERIFNDIARSPMIKNPQIRETASKLNQSLIDRFAGEDPALDVLHKFSNADADLEKARTGAVDTMDGVSQKIAGLIDPTKAPTMDNLKDVWNHMNQVTKNFDAKAAVLNENLSEQQRRELAGLAWQEKMAEEQKKVQFAQQTLQQSLQTRRQWEQFIVSMLAENAESRANIINVTRKASATIAASTIETTQSIMKTFMQVNKGWLNVF